MAGVLEEHSAAERAAQAGSRTSEDAEEEPVHREQPLFHDRTSANPEPKSGQLGGGARTRYKQLLTQAFWVTGCARPGFLNGETRLQNCA